MVLDESVFLERIYMRQKMVEHQRDWLFSDRLGSLFTGQAFAAFDCSENDELLVGERQREIDHSAICPAADAHARSAAATALRDVISEHS